MCKRKKLAVDKETDGRLYVFRFTLSCGTTVWKVGMCGVDRTHDRLFEVLRSFYNTYRYIPETKVCLYKKYLVPSLVESHMHKELTEYSYEFDKKFDGYTEFFSDLDESMLLDYIREYTDEDCWKCNKMTTLQYEALTKGLDSKKKVVVDSLPDSIK